VRQPAEDLVGFYRFIQNTLRKNQIPAEDTAISWFYKSNFIINIT
jgi:hypothetical protein